MKTKNTRSKTAPTGCGRKTETIMTMRRSLALLKYQQRKNKKETRKQAFSERCVLTRPRISRHQAVGAKYKTTRAILLFHAELCVRWILGYPDAEVLAARASTCGPFYFHSPHQPHFPQPSKNDIGVSEHRLECSGRLRIHDTNHVQERMRVSDVALVVTSKSSRCRSQFLSNAPSQPQNLQTPTHRPDA